MTVCEWEAAEVRRAADDLLSGVSLHAIARDWNARGVPTSTWRPPLALTKWKPTESGKHSSDRATRGAWTCPTAAPSSRP